MAKISTYTTDSNISPSDKLIGTDADSNNETKNFLISDLSAYMTGGIVGNLAITNVLNASDTNDQVPSALDTPLQVTFGIAQGTVADPVMVDASGNITFNESGIYLINGYASFGRGGVSGPAAVIAFRALINDVQVGATKVTEIKDADDVVPYDLTIPINATADDVLTWEIMRDSVGADRGGLYAITLLGGWSNVPSATLSIYKIGI
jgi:hypothetical protein